MAELGLYDIVIRLIAALLCGAVLGWERETRNKPAGFRTIMLISLGAASFTLVSLRLAQETWNPPNPFDPLRVMQGIIGGIGFLGAGAIIRAGGSVTGMTTAATIWVVGAAGVACGVGALDVAALSVLFCFLILTCLDFVERRLIPTKEPADHPRQDDTDGK